MNQKLLTTVPALLLFIAGPFQWATCKETQQPKGFFSGNCSFDVLAMMQTDPKAIISTYMMYPAIQLAEKKLRAEILPQCDVQFTYLLNETGQRSCEAQEDFGIAMYLKAFYGKLDTERRVGLLIGPGCSTVTQQVALVAAGLYLERRARSEIFQTEQLKTVSIRDEAQLIEQ